LDQSPKCPESDDTEPRPVCVSIVAAAENDYGSSLQQLSWLASRQRLSSDTLLVKRLLRTHLAGDTCWLYRRPAIRGPQQVDEWLCRRNPAFEECHRSRESHCHRRH